MNKVNSILFSLLFLIAVSEARRGCCSWHGGVCGCMCCDGSSLSYKCAPYYPSCVEKPVRSKKNAEKISQDSLMVIQTSLKELGYYTGEVDGLYGRNTSKAIKKFQKDNDLDASGDIDSGTEDRLNEKVTTE